MGMKTMTGTAFGSSAAALLALTFLVCPALGASNTAIPDFSGIWAHPSLGFESPLPGPGSGA
jgi:hypothetical protein